MRGAAGPCHGRGPVKIREASRHDLFAWLRLRQSLWPECSPERHRGEMAAIRRQRQTATVMLAVNHAGEVVGFVEVALRAFAEGCDSSPVAYLEGLFVEAGSREQGIGRALVESAEGWARNKGCRELAADTPWDDNVSVEVHRSLGFEPTATLLHFKKRLPSEPS